MIRKLRIKFIAISMISVIIVLVVIMGAINFMNYNRIVANADNVLEALEYSGGSFDVGPENGGQMPGSQHPGGVPALPNEDDSRNAPESSTEIPSENSDQKYRLLEGEDDNDADADDTEDADDADDPADSDDADDKNDSDDDDDSFDDFRRHSGKDMSEEIPFESRYFSVLFDKDGNILSTDTNRIAAVNESSAQEYARTVYNKDKEHGFVSDYRYLVSDNDDGTVRILFLDTSRGLDNFRDFLKISVLVCLIGLAAVFFLIILFSKWVTRPVSESYEKQKQFITDAGHEIKTPLAIIAADVSVIEMESGQSEWLDDIKAQTVRMTDLTNELIFLSRMEEADRHMKFIEFPLSDMVSETAKSFESRALVDDKKFECEIAPGVSYTGDEKALRQLVSVLLDNAIKYSEEGGKIKLALAKDSRSVKLSVFNTTPEINKEDLKHMFDRFYRADRSRNSEKGGYGIGLSIASAVVQSHKGKITATTEDKKSLLITVILP